MDHRVYNYQNPIPIDRPPAWAGLPARSGTRTARLAWRRAAACPGTRPRSASRAAASRRDRARAAAGRIAALVWSWLGSAGCNRVTKDERRTLQPFGSRFSVLGSGLPEMIRSVRPDRSCSAHASFTVCSIVGEITYASADARAARPAARHPRRWLRCGVPIAQTPGLAGLPGGRAAPQPQPRYSARPALARGG